MADADPTSISYTVKELLARLDVKADQIITSVATKADQVAVEQLASRVSSLETDAAKSMAVAEASRKTASNNRWLIFTAVPTTIATTVGIVALFIR